MGDLQRRLSFYAMLRESWRKIYFCSRSPACLRLVDDIKMLLRSESEYCRYRYYAAVTQDGAEKFCILFIAYLQIYIPEKSMKPIKIFLCIWDLNC